jgi:hypothetical protein
MLTRQTRILSKLARFSEIGTMVGFFFLALWFVSWWRALIAAFVLTRIFIMLVMLGYTARRCGLGHLGNWPTMLKINALGKLAGGQAAVSVFILIYVILLPLILLFDFPLDIAVALWLVALANLGCVVLPPSVLFLAASQPDSLRFERELRGTVFPLRAVSMLDPGLSPLTDPIENVRTQGQEDWEWVVEKLSEFAIVLIDGRTTSAAVEREVQLLLEGPRLRMTCVLVADDYRSPMFDAVTGSREAANQAGWVTLPREILLGAFLTLAHAPGIMKRFEDVRRALLAGQSKFDSRARS